MKTRMLLASIQYGITASAVVLGSAAWQPARPSAVIGLHGRRLLVFPLAFTVAALGLLAVHVADPVHPAAYVLALLTVQRAGRPQPRKRANVASRSAATPATPL